MSYKIPGIRRIRTPFKEAPSERSKQQRIRIPQPVERPFHIRSRDLVQQEYLRKSPWWEVIHKRGLTRPLVGTDALEDRAVPKGMVRGTLPERIVLYYLINKLHMQQDIDFDFQCLAGHHRVLTPDLRWVAIRDLKIGDSVLSFSKDHTSDNERHMRKWEVGTVINNKPSIEDCLSVKLSNGNKIICTKIHPWLIHYSPKKRDWGMTTPYNWVEAQNLKIGAYVPQFAELWDFINSWESGYVSGFIDGEGSIVHGKTSVGGHAITLTASQNEGVVLDTYLDCVQKLGFEFSNYNYPHLPGKNRHDIRIKGGRSEAMRILGTVRPSKMTTQFCPDKLGRLTKIRNVIVEEIVEIGEHEIYKLGVDNQTYIAEGFGMHNSSLQGGRLQLGGLVVDFLFEIMKIALNVQGPTHKGYLRGRKDEEQRNILDSMGYTVYELWEDTIYNEYKLDDEMRRIFWLGESSGSGYELSEAQSVPQEDLLGILARTEDLVTLAGFI